METFNYHCSSFAFVYIVIIQIFIAYIKL